MFLILYHGIHHIKRLENKIKIHKAALATTGQSNERKCLLPAYNGTTGGTEYIITLYYGVVSHGTNYKHMGFTMLNIVVF